MTEFDEILSKALEAVRFYHPRLNAEIYAFPKPANRSGNDGLATPSIREIYCRTALLWLDRLSKSGEFETGGNHHWSVTLSGFPRRAHLHSA
ncbi:hypothetical protein ACVWZL_008594 [Bradyrhizobium sp. GM2.4]